MIEVEKEDQQVHLPHLRLYITSYSSMHERIIPFLGAYYTKGHHPLSYP